MLREELYADENTGTVPWTNGIDVMALTERLSYARSLLMTAPLIFLYTGIMGSLVSGQFDRRFARADPARMFADLGAR